MSVACLALHSLTGCSRDFNNVFEATIVDSNQPILVRARGATGNESIELRINDVTVQVWRVSTSYQNYIYNASSASVNIKVYFNDAGGGVRGINDVQIDYIQANGVTNQAENQVNTGAWVNDACGTSFSEWIICEGYIDFGTITLGKQAQTVAEVGVPTGW